MTLGKSPDLSEHPFPHMEKEEPGDVRIPWVRIKKEDLDLRQINSPRGRSEQLIPAASICQRAVFASKLAS